MRTAFFTSEKQHDDNNHSITSSTALRFAQHAGNVFADVIAVLLLAIATTAIVGLTIRTLLASPAANCGL